MRATSLANRVTTVIRGKSGRVLVEREDSSSKRSIKGKRCQRLASRSNCIALELCYNFLGAYMAITPESVAVWRDIALVLLCIEAAVIVAVPGVALFFAQKYLRIFRHWLRLPLLRVLVYTLRAQNITLRASSGIVSVPIAMQMLGERVRSTARRLVVRG